MTCASCHSNSPLSFFTRYRKRATVADGTAEPRVNNRFWLLEPGAKDKCRSKPYRSSVVQIQSRLSTPRCFPLKLLRKNSSPKRKGNFSVRSMKKLWISLLDPFRSLGTVQKSSSEGHAKREACLCAEKQTRCPCSIWLQGMCSGRPKHDTVFCSTASSDSAFPPPRAAARTRDISSKSSHSARTKDFHQ